MMIIQSSDNPQKKELNLIPQKQQLQSIIFVPYRKRRRMHTRLIKGSGYKDTL